MHKQTIYREYFNKWLKNYFIVKNDAGLILQINGDNTANDAGASASLDPVSDCPR